LAPIARREASLAPAERIGEAINYGVAAGLVPGLAIAAVVLMIGIRT
jgi:hypothetical protein